MKSFPIKNVKTAVFPKNMTNRQFKVNLQKIIRTICHDIKSNLKPMMNVFGVV